MTAIEKWEIYEPFPRFTYLNKNIEIIKEDKHACFMDNSKQNIIKEIAQELDCGFDCFYNSKTDEIITIPNFSSIADEDDFKEAFREDLEKVKKQQTDFIKIEVLQSFESFKIMKLFVEQLPDKKFQLELENVLANKKPFQNFKHKIDNSGFRQQWFDFKQSELEKIVKNQLDSAQQRI